MTDLEILRVARELLSNKARWTQGKFAGDEADIEIYRFSKDAVCFCALGAVDHIAGEIRTIESLSEAAHELHSLDISGVNDRLGYEATLQMFDRAIELEQAK